MTVMVSCDIKYHLDRDTETDYELIVNIYETDNPLILGVPHDDIQSGDVTTALAK